MSDGAFYPWLKVPRRDAIDLNDDAAYRNVSYAWRFGPKPDQERYQRALRDAYGKTAYCKCTTTLQPMAIKAYGQPPTYNVAIHAHTGAAHHRSCTFWSNNYIGGDLLRRYHGAITVDDNDIATIRLDIPLTRAVQPNRQPNAAPVQPQAAPADAYGTASVHGMLNYLWERAKLCMWRPDGAPRTTLSVSRRAWKTATQIRTGTFALADLLLTAPAGLAEPAHSLKLRRAFLHAHRHQHALIMLAILDADASSITARLRTAGKSIGIDVLIPDNVIAAIARSYERQIRYERGRLIALAYGFPASPNLEFEVTKVAIVASNDQFIPVDSLYEMTIANKLIAESRRFTKPLRDPNADHLPDFILDDTSPLTELEVFGRTDPDYQVRAAKKRERGVWSWDATSTRTIPPFPPATIEAASPQP